MELKNKNILITGGLGMIARQLLPLLKEEFPKKIVVSDIIPLPDNVYINSKNIEYIQVDLRNRKDCKLLFKNIDIVFHLAGIKGSPKRCSECPASFSIPMIQFNANMIEAAYENNVEWYLFTSSVGVYPPAPIFYEDSMWKGFPSENDKFAGWAKRMGELHIEAYNIEYNWERTSIVRPANVYGEYDNFNEYSMVIPSLIKKGINDNVIIVWGDGTQIRDLIYSGDVAKGMIYMVKNEIKDPVNLGSGVGITIKDIANIVSKRFGKKIIWDISKPTGDEKRILDITRMMSYGFKPEISIDVGINKTINWYKRYLQGEDVYVL